MSTTIINHITGDVTQPHGDGPFIIAHIVNDVGAFGAGVAKTIKARWPFAAEAYRDWHREGKSGGFELGKVQVADCMSGEPRVMIVNMLAQHGLRSRTNPAPIGDYSALRMCLRELGWLASKLKIGVHLPRIGCGLAGGEWSKVEPIVVDELCRRGIEVKVYDLPERTT